MRLFVAALVLAAVVPARAHHPFAPYYDASKLVSVTGVVVELRDVNAPYRCHLRPQTPPDGSSSSGSSFDSQILRLGVKTRRGA